MSGSRIAFGPFAFDRASQTLWRSDQQLAIGSRAAAILGALLAAEGEVVTREALLNAAWDGVFVEDNNLAVQVGVLRRTLGLRGDGEEWIATVPRVGYRLARQAPPSGGGRPSLAVLPFINLSGDPAQEHIVDGIVEDLTTAFSRFRNFGVVARQSAFAFKNRQFDMREAARTLGVGYLLEGSLRRFGSRVRVTAQLIDGTSGQHLWAENLDGELDDIFDFQDRVTSGVVGVIEPEIRKAEIDRALRKHPESLDAYDLYWRGLALLQTADRDGYADAVELLDRAAALEPRHASVLSMAAFAHIKRPGTTAAEVAADTAAAATLSERALAIDSSDPFALLVAGMVELDRGRTEKGLALADRAYELNPNSLLICNITGYLHWTCGNYDETITRSLRALHICPGVPEVFWGMIGIARAHLSSGRIDDALLWAQRSLDAHPDQDEVLPILSAAYALSGQMPEAETTLSTLLRLRPDISLAGLIASSEGRVNLHQREGLSRLAASQPERQFSAAPQVVS